MVRVQIVEGMILTGIEQQQDEILGTNDNIKDNIEGDIEDNTDKNQGQHQV